MDAFYSCVNYSQCLGELLSAPEFLCELGQYDYPSLIARALNLHRAFFGDERSFESTAYLAILFRSLALVCNRLSSSPSMLDSVFPEQIHRAKVIQTAIELLQARADDEEILQAILELFDRILSPGYRADQALRSQLLTSVFYTLQHYLGTISVNDNSLDQLVFLLWTQVGSEWFFQTEEYTELSARYLFRKYGRRFESTPAKLITELTETFLMSCSPTLKESFVNEGMS
jgi:hypothetical protein